MGTTKLLRKAAFALLSIIFLDAHAQSVSGSFTLYNSNGSPLQLGQNGVDSQTVNLSSLTQSLAGFSGFSSLQVNVALVGNNPLSQVSDTYSGYSFSHDVYSPDGSVEYVYFTRNENISEAYGASAAGLSVGNSSNSGYAPYYTSTTQTLSSYQEYSEYAPYGLTLSNGVVQVYGDAGAPNNYCNVGDCHGILTKNQYVNASGYVGEYGITDALGLYDIAGVNATHAINYAISSSGSNEVLAVTLDYTYAPVPLPATALMMVGGLGALGAFARKRRTGGASLPAAQG